MRRPERRFYFFLAKELHMSINRVLAEHDARDLAEWQAFYLTQNEDWVKAYKAKNNDQSDLAASIRETFKI
jgi:hypothetical protein